MPISYFAPKNHKLNLVTHTNQNLLQDAVWIDLLLPTREEELLIEKIFEIKISSREEMQLKVNLVTKDITSLNDHIFFLSNKTNFLLDATLGMISIEQNDIIKIFSIAAVILLPPTLVATIYGMNFHIPELTWRFGYFYALILMALSTWLPYKYIKKK